MNKTASASSYHRPARRGFSLIEVAIVVLVLSIIAALALPMLHGTDATRLKEAARLLAADLAFAQNESVTHADDPRVVVFDAASNTYHIATASDTAAPIEQPVGGGPYAVTFGEGRARELTDVAIGSLSMNGDPGSTADELGFEIYGQLDQATDATIELTSNGMSITLTINADTGETTISDLN